MRKREATENVAGFEHRGQHRLETGKDEGIIIPHSLQK